jgi:hypothetical protein
MATGAFPPWRNILFTHELCLNRNRKQPVLRILSLCSSSVDSTRQLFSCNDDMRYRHSTPHHSSLLVANAFASTPFVSLKSRLYFVPYSTATASATATATAATVTSAPTTTVVVTNNNKKIQQLDDIHIPTGSRPLGSPMPTDEHACSVSLPTWSSVVGYEEGDTMIIQAMRCGYPRFVYHPYVVLLMNYYWNDVLINNLLLLGIVIILPFIHHHHHHHHRNKKIVLSCLRPKLPNDVAYFCKSHWNAVKVQQHHHHHQG